MGSRAQDELKERLRKARDEIDVTRYTSYRSFLIAIYDAVKTNRKSYSYARFSADLGLSESNALWQALNERRDLSESSAERVAKSLHMNADSKKYFLLLVRHNNAKSPEVREDCMKQLMALKSRSLDEPAHEDALEYFSEWYHPIIREMVGLDEFIANPDWVNERLFLKIDPRKIERSLQLLTNLQLIRFEPERGRLVQTGQQITPDRAVAALASVRYHQKACEITRECVSGVSPGRRDLNILTLCISDETANELKTILHDACRKAMELEARSPQRDQVYQVNIQLFALTK
jgi:uncharacterized protein (TIGR02147 family)